MSSELVYLKPNVVFEPLIDNWYAWSHLISPATWAMNMKNRHLKILESYIDAPDIHAEAVKNPNMKGGPFMDFDGIKVDEVKKLQNHVLTNRKNNLALARAIYELELLLETEAKGSSLEVLYKKIPAELRGFVELFYDRHNNPGYRFFESLLYKSEYFTPSSQSIALWITNNDHRPFALSTPRLNDDENVLFLDIPFSDERIDILSKMRHTPSHFDFIKEKLKIDTKDEDLFKSFFTHTPPPTYDKYKGDKIRMRYFGHACILIETCDVSILVDPLISYYGYESDISHFSDMDLPDTIDYVLITHNHQDHILLETLLPLRNKIKNIVVPRTNSGLLEDPDVKLMFENIGFTNVMAIDEMETLKFADAEIMGIPFTGEHSDLNIRAKSCFLVKIKDFKLMFLADSRIIDPYIYENIQRYVGNIDVVLMGMECDGAPLSWLYGPLFTKRIQRDHDNSRRLAGSDCQTGMNIVNIFKPSEVYVYAMGQEPWVEFISSIKYNDESNPIVQSNLLVKECEKMNIVAERLYGEKELLYNKLGNKTT